MLKRESVRLVEGFFDYLNDQLIPYCILRNYEQLPDSIGHVIDILFDDKSQYEINQIVSRIVTQLGWNCTCTRCEVDYTTFICWKVIKGDWQHVKLDICSALLWRGLPCLDAAYILYKRRPYKKRYFIPSPGCEAALILLIETLRKGELPEKHYSKIQSLVADKTSKTDFCKTLAPMRQGIAEKFFKACVNANWRFIDKNSRLLRRQIVLQNTGISGVARFVSYSTKRLERKMDDYFNPKGLLIVLAGPDGSGKTSVAQKLTDNLGAYFPKQKVFHARPGIFPQLKTGLGKKQHKTSAPDANNPGDKPAAKKLSIFGKTAAWLAVAYYTLEFAAGRHLIKSAKRKSGLIIFDRYYYDFFIKPTTRDLIWPLKNLLLKPVPKPDLIIHLAADPQTACSRKQELHASEIELQNQYLSRVLQGMQRVKTVRTDQLSIDEAAAAVCEEVAMHHLKQYKCSLSDRK